MRTHDNTKTDDIKNEGISLDENTLKVLRYDYDLRRRAEREETREIRRQRETFGD